MSSDDEPPALDATFIEAEEGGEVIELNEEKSIMEQMVEEATRAKEKKQERLRKERKKKEKSFGTGLKKGFFHSNPQKPSVKKETIPTIRPKAKEATDSSLRFPEVQQALNQMNQLNPKEWMTPDFMETISKNPRLLLALQNPRFTQAIEEMKTNPTAALTKYQNDKDICSMLMEFMGFLGNHFEKMGKIQDVPDAAQVRKNAIETMDRDPQEEATVQRILSDPELMEILADPKMKKILVQCQQPGALRMFATNPEIGPKIRKLMDAGLVQLHP